MALNSSKDQRKTSTSLSRHDFALQKIQEYIVKSELKAGDMIPTEKVLAELLQLSRTSIREALRSMEARGIIEAHQGQGRFLRGFNYDGLVANLSYNLEINTKQFKEVIDIRIALELHFLENIVMDYTIEDFRRIEACFERLKEASNKNVHEDRLIEIHKEFHLALYQGANNKLLLHLIGMFAEFQQTLSRRDEYPIMYTPDFIDLHEQLVQALYLREPFYIRAKLIEHFRDVIKWTRR